jgi:LCP family protein required for cell wall assembly
MPRANKGKKAGLKQTWEKIWGNFWGKFGISFAATILVIGGIAAIGYAYIFGGLNIVDDLSNEEAGIVAQDYHSKDIVNIALFGIDSMENNLVGRSDSIVVVSLDHKNKEIRLSAIERDTYVPIEGHGKDKINHAFSFGGAPLAVKTLNQNFGLDIKDYAIVNFNNMVKVIDALGGVRMDVPAKYLYEVNRIIRASEQERGVYTAPIEKSGYQLLTGDQALAMARARNSVGGTSVRAGMHEEILNACFDRLKEISALEYPNVAKNLLALVNTSMSSGEVTNMAIKVVTGGYELRKEVFPLQQDWLSGNMIDGIWYRTYNYETGNENIRNFIYKGILPEGVE